MQETTSDDDKSWKEKQVIVGKFRNLKQTISGGICIRQCMEFLWTLS